MRHWLVVLLLSVVLGVAFATARADASTRSGTASEPAVHRQESVDDGDDTRVEVQLTVLAVALVVVVGLGVPLYFLRRRLGFVPPPPGEDASGSHH